MHTLPMRKRNRLQNWDYSAESVYFITICTAQKQCTLGQVVGGDAHIAPHIRLSTHGKIADRFLQTVPGMMQYCIMPNHIHMLLEIPSGSMRASTPTQSVSQRIRSFKILVSKECGVSLFQRSFYDHIVRDEADYLRICEYIDTNPAKWADDVYYV